MAIKDEATRIEDGKTLATHKGNVLRYTNQIDLELAAMNVIGNKYDAAVRAEVAADIVELKVEIDKVYKKY